MNSILNLNTTWTTTNFLYYIEHSFSSTVADWYDALNEGGKNTLRMMETLAAMFKNLCKEIKTEFIGVTLDYEEKAIEWQRKIDNIELWDMKSLGNYIVEFSQYCYKIGYDETTLGMSMTN